MPFWYQLVATVHVPRCRHVSSNGGHCAQDGWMPQTAALDPTLSPDVYTVRVHARVRAIRMYRLIDVWRHLLSQSCLQRATKRPVTDLTGKTQAVLPPSTVKRFPEVNKLPHKDVHHVALSLTCPLCERETPQTVFINKTTGGLACPPCKIHGELVRLGGLSGAVRGRGSNV